MAPVQSKQARNPSTNHHGHRQLPMTDTTNRSSRPTERGRQPTSRTDPHEASDREEYSSSHAGHKRSGPVDDSSDQENTPRNQSARKRPRPQEHTGETTEEDESDNADGPITQPEYVTTLMGKGRIATRYVSSTCHWPSVLALGLKRDPKDDASKYTKQQNEMYDIFQRLEALVPDLRDALLHFGAGSALDFGKAIQTGAKAAHSIDVRTIKAHMQQRLAKHDYNPHAKHEMGFRNKRCAQLLTPADLDYDSDLDAQGNPGLQKKLRDGVLVPRPEDFHKGLFHNEEVDLVNLSAGFLKSEELVKSYQAIFISPSSAVDASGGNKGTVKGNAAKHEILEVSLDSIIYIAHLDHFVWSSQLVYSATGGNGQFNYRLFCKTIKDTVMSWPESDVESLLEWWNEQIFPESTVRPTPMRADGAISIAERMKIQAKTARAEAEEAANARVQEIQARARELQASNPV
ncbi:hypothetical protein B0H13DRAFT_2664707 [Mycena leptocephala]|nr:hypothetical protein B0H13DRAFT_2664707 [Mycena leptocephala]